MLGDQAVLLRLVDEARRADEPLLCAAEQLGLISGAPAYEPRSDAPPKGVPVGSVVDITWQGHRLRVHLDPALAPEWDGDSEPVLGTSVPVDSGTLIDRWYVHRIRLATSGTERTVQLGTEAFARPVRWFALSDCELGEQSLSTPAVREILRSRRSHRPGAAALPRQVTGADRAGEELLRRLATARRIESVPVTDRTCAEIAEHIRAHPSTARTLAPSRGQALRWAAAKRADRHELFADLTVAVQDQAELEAVRRLLERLDAEAPRHRSEEEDATARAAHIYLASGDTAGPQAERDKRIARAAAVRARYLLRVLRPSSKKLLKASKRRPASGNIELLVEVATAAGDCLSPQHQRQVEQWKRAVGLNSRGGAAQRRPPPPAPAAMDVPCTNCGQPAGRPCRTPRRRPHAARVQAAQEHANRDHN